MGQDVEDLALIAAQSDLECCVGGPRVCVAVLPKVVHALAEPSVAGSTFTQIGADVAGAASACR